MYLDLDGRLKGIEPFEGDKARKEKALREAIILMNNVLMTFAELSNLKPEIMADVMEKLFHVQATVEMNLGRKDD